MPTEESGVCFRDGDGELRWLTFVERTDSAAYAQCEGLAVAMVPRKLREGGKVVKLRITEDQD